MPRLLCLAGFLCVALLVSSCAPSGHWSHPLKHHEQFIVDDLSCARYAAQAASGVNSPTLSLVLKNNSYSGCMKSLGWRKGDISQGNMDGLSEPERLLVGEWIGHLNMKGLSATEVLGIFPDGKYVSNLSISPDVENFTIEGVWKLAGEAIKFTVMKSLVPFAPPGQTTTVQIDMIDSRILKLTSGRFEDSITYVRAMPQSYDSNQTLLPNTRGTDSEGGRTKSTGQSTIIKYDAYGPGVHMDQYGRAVKVIPQ
jgi:hypothetical protein